MKIRNSRIEKTMLKATAILVALPLPAMAQTAAVGKDTVMLEEVIITAERRTENVQKTAASVSVRSGDALQAAGKYSLANILEDLPGMGPLANPQFGGGTDNGASALRIRGIPSNVGVGGATVSVPSSAAVYVDGISEGTGGSYDIDRVELLRGPQGTLYGRSATSGVVAVHTRNPELGQFGGNLSAEFGNFGLQHYSGAVNLPLGDKVALRVSGNRYLRDGYDAHRDLSYGNNKDFRAKLLIKPTDTLSVLLGVAEQDNVIAGGGVNTYFTAPNSYRFEYVSGGQPVPVSPGQNTTRQYWAEINWDLGFATLTYQPSFRTFGNTYLTKVRAIPIFAFDQNISTPKDDFLTNELRLASRPESKLKWQAGTLLYDNKLQNISRFTNQPSGSLRTDTNTQRDTKAWGVFAEATYPITDSWRITGGLRYDHTKVAVTQTLTSNATPGIPAGGATAGFPEVLTSKTLSGPAGERTYTTTTYKGRVEHDLTPRNMIYAMVSTAASPGAVTLTLNLTNNLIVQELRSETNTAYEIGSKNRFLDDRLQVNASVYYNDYGGYQTLGINVNPVPPPFGSSIFQTLVAPMKVVGAELETQFKPWANGVIGLNLAYTHSYFSDRSVATPIGTTFGTYFGRSNVPGIVPFTAQLSYDHTLHLSKGSELTFGGDVYHMSEYDVDRITGTQMANPVLADALVPYIRSPAHEFVNLHGAWSFANGKYSISGWVRNVGGKRYKVSAAGVQNVTTTTGTGLNTITTSLSAPRTWGMSVNAKF